MTGFRDDILAQPDNLRRSAAVFLDALGRADLAAFEPGPVLFTGMGASFFAVVPAASVPMKQPSTSNARSLSSRSSMPFSGKPPMARPRSVIKPR